MILRVEQMSGGYTREPVLEDISFALRTGEVLGIIGPNGSGKSTLLRIISRVLMPREGRVLLEEADIARIPLRDFCRRVAFVSPDMTTYFPFTVWDIVLMGRIPHLKKLQQETKKDRLIVEESLRETDTYQIKDKRIDHISAGERQRVLIAKALCQEPRLLLLDEPTSHLDIGYQIQILTLLKELNVQKNLSIAMVIHDLNLASEYCHKLLLLSEGRVYQQGTPQEVLTYQNIEAVYKTIVLVHNNPVSKKPYVMVMAKEHVSKMTSADGGFDCDARRRVP